MTEIGEGLSPQKPLNVKEIDIKNLKKADNLS